ncbi:hypothetical protein CCP2SC5_1980005 [Azospirillaceae bacterium]
MVVILSMVSSVYTRPTFRAFYQKIWIAIMLCLLCLPTVGRAQEKGQETIVFDENNPPFMYNGGGGAKGLYPLFIKAGFYRMGVPGGLQTPPGGGGWNLGVLFGGGLVGSRG